MAVLSCVVDPRVCEMCFATAADQNDTNCVLKQQHRGEAIHTNSRWSDERHEKPSAPPPWHNQSASDVAIHLYRSACASFLMGTANICLPWTTMIASQPISFLAVMRSFFCFTCTRCPCLSPSKSTPHLERSFTTTWSTSEEVISASASQGATLRLHRKWNFEHH